jgi:hypothetical protein
MRAMCGHSDCSIWQTGRHPTATGQAEKELTSGVLPVFDLHRAHRVRMLRDQRQEHLNKGSSGVPVSPLFLTRLTACANQRLAEQGL